MVPLPGMGAMIRMPNAAKLKAMSSSRFLILEIRMPGAGTISYKVTVGPTSAEMLETSMLKFRSVWMIRVLLSSNSSSLTWTLPLPCATKRSKLGNSNRLKSKVGSYSPKSCTFWSISSSDNCASSNATFTSNATSSSPFSSLSGFVGVGATGGTRLGSGAALPSNSVKSSSKVASVSSSSSRRTGSSVTALEAGVLMSSCSQGRSEDSCSVSGSSLSAMESGSSSEVFRLSQALASASSEENHRAILAKENSESWFN